MIFPIIQFVRKRRRGLSDIEYLAAIEFGVLASGALTSSSVVFSSTGVKAIITPAAGKFAYITKAYVSASPQATSGIPRYVAQLRNNTSVIETIDAAVAGGGGSGSWNSLGPQNNFGSTGESLNGDTFIQCLIIDDADSPRIQ